MAKEYKFWIVIIGVVFLTGCKNAGLFELERKNLLLTGAASDVTANSAIVYGELLDVNITGEKVIQHGHCWSIDNPNPTISDTTTITKLGEARQAGIFQSQLTNLRSETQYYARAYVQTNTNQIIYGSVVIFTTTRIFEYFNLPITNITQTTATLRSRIDIAGVTLVDYGHCWSTKPNITIDENEGKQGKGELSNSTVFTTQLTNLTPNTTYYFVSYLVDSDGFKYYTPLSQFTTAK